MMKHTGPEVIRSRVQSLKEIHNNNEQKNSEIEYTIHDNSNFPPYHINSWILYLYGGKYSDNLKNVSKAYGSIDHAYIFSIIMVYFTYHV